MTCFFEHTLINESGQEKLGNLEMSLPGNMTCSQEIFRSNTINFAIFKEKIKNLR